MEDHDVHRAAEALLHAHATREWLDPAGFGWSPTTDTDSLAVQAATLRVLGPVGGWKVGAGTPGGPATLAPLPCAGVHSGPAHTVVAGAHRLRGVEVEVAFRLARDLPARVPAYTDAEVAEAVDAACLAVEIVESRFVDREAAPPLWALADLQSHGALVTGPMHTAWQDLALDSVAVDLRFGDRQVVDRACVNSGGTPFGMVVRLANLCGEHCGGLKAGQVITTGSLMGVEFAPPGVAVRASVVGLGDLSLTFAPD